MKTILVIDDEKDLIKLIDLHLSKEGYLVIGAKNGIEGLDIALKHKPDLILLDLMMPKLDGLEVCKRLKSATETSRIPVVMLTISKDEKDIETSYDLGAASFITKPLTFHGLVEVLKVFKQYWFEIVELPRKA